MAFDARDWGQNKRDAWLYAVLIGWGDALQEVAERHGWDAPTVTRIKRMQRSLPGAKTRR